LSVEEQFYLLWPIAICWLTGRRKTNVVFGGGIAALAIIFMATASRFVFAHFLHLEFLAQHLFLTQADSIMCGCLLALLVTSSNLTFLRIINFYPHISRLVAVALLAVSLSSIKVRLIFGPTFGPTVQSALIAYLVGSFTLVRSGISYHFLNFSPMQWIGRLSYSLYIWQQLFLFLKVMPAFWFQRFPQNLAFVFLAAIASYYLIEKPFLNLKKRFSKIQHAPLESQASP
jgi:peptidoglycan/LPS O-acetylase OafA/YrhL